MSIYELYTNDELLAIRNLLRTSEARLLLRFIGDMYGEKATKQPFNAEAIKGMASLVHEVKLLPNEIEGVISHRKER